MYLERVRCAGGVEADNLLIGCLLCGRGGVDIRPVRLMLGVLGALGSVL